MWQDVKVQPDKRYGFSIYAQHDQIDPAIHDAKTIELRIESGTPDGQVTVNSQTFDVAGLPTGPNWAHLTVSGTAATDTLRVLVIVTAADTGPRGGVVKLDDASLCAMPGEAVGLIGASSPTAAKDNSLNEMIVPADARSYRDLTYASRDGRDMKLDLFLPPGEGLFPLVIWIHGGAWKLGDKVSYPHMMFLLRSGFAVANIEYRLSQIAAAPEI